MIFSACSFFLLTPARRRRCATHGTGSPSLEPISAPDAYWRWSPAEARDMVRVGELSAASASSSYLSIHALLTMDHSLLLCPTPSLPYVFQPRLSSCLIRRCRRLSSPVATGLVPISLPCVSPCVSFLSLCARLAPGQDGAFSLPVPTVLSSPRAY